MISSAGSSYNSYGNITETTGSHGERVKYDYLYNTGFLTDVTDPKGNKTSYEYSDSKQVTSITSGGSIVNYGYDTNDRLSLVSSPSGTTYSLEYDSFGRRVKTDVGESTLSTNVYNSKGLLQSTTYGNGVTVRNNYDELL